MCLLNIIKGKLNYTKVSFAALYAVWCETNRQLLAPNASIIPRELK